MKKRILLFTSSIGLFSIMLMSNNLGPAVQGNLNRTGTNGTLTTCGGVGCHTGGSYTNTPILTLFDSTGANIVTTWQPNHTYRIVLGGQTSAPKFGFQMAATWFDGSNDLQAGTFSNLSSGTHPTVMSGITIIEHGSARTVTGGLYAVNTDWKAPNVTSLDTITFRATVNSVNGTGNELGDISFHTTLKVGRNTASVKEVATTQQLNTYPNPFTDKLNIKMENVDNGTYTINVIDLRGKWISSQTVDVNKNFETSINTEKWASGMYYVNFRKGHASQTMAVVKQ